MKKVSLLHILTMLLFCLGILFFGAKQHLFSFLVGSGGIWANLLILWAGWALIFRKKLVALAIGLIVFKYAILGIIMFKLVKQPWFEPGWFAAGVASFVITSLLYSMTEYKIQDIDDENESLKEGKENGI